MFKIIFILNSKIKKLLIYFIFKINKEFYFIICKIAIQILTFIYN